MLFAKEKNLSQAFLQICRETVLSGNVLLPVESHVKQVFWWTRVYGYSDAHSL